MVFQEKCVLSIYGRDGKPIRETKDRKVFVPFNSEFSVYLKNLYDDYRVKVKLTVDGMSVGTFILDPNESMNVERFLEGSLDKGSRFKFVPVGDSEVQDPSNVENGVVEAQFFRAVETSYAPYRIPPKAEEHHHHHYHYDCVPMPLVYQPKPWECPYPNPVVTWCSASNGSAGSVQTTGTFGGDVTVGGSCTTGQAFSVGCSDTSTVSTLSTVKAKTASVGLAGATVAGSESSQKFVLTDSFSVLATPTILKLKLVGDPLVREEASKKYCVECGAKTKETFKFCPSCGKLL